MKTLFIVSIIVTGAWAAIYYVDGRLADDCDGVTYHYHPADRSRNSGAGQRAYRKFKVPNDSMVAGDSCVIRGATSGYDTIYVGYHGSDTGGIYPTRSGSGADNRITYCIYPGEKAELVGNVVFAEGIEIINQNWVRVTGYNGSAGEGIKISNMQFGFRICDTKTSTGFDSGSHYNEIAYCEFTKSESTVVALGLDCGNQIQHNARFNWLHHCKMHDLGGYDSVKDIGTCLDLGWPDCGISDGYVCTDSSRFNVIENNVMYHGGHHVIMILNNRNVIRNNTFHNEQWFKYPPESSIRYGYRTIETQGVYNEDLQNGLNLIEGNRISHTSDNPNNSVEAGVHMAASRNIFRYNDSYAHMGYAFIYESHNSTTTGRVKYNHVYNNTIFACGHGATLPGTINPPVRNTTPDRSTIFCTGYDTLMTRCYYGNVVKNNIAWKGAGRFAAINIYTEDWAWSACDGYDVCGDWIFDHNYKDSLSDPKFVNEGSYASPHIDSSDQEWYWQISPDGSDILTLNTEPDFNLQSTSPCIDSGTYLTLAFGAGEASNKICVDDKNYFWPGWGNGAGGGAVVNSDWIAVGTVGNVVQIDSMTIDTTNDTVYLKSNITWADDAPVWLYKKSDGVRVLYGTTTDAGAHERNPGKKFSKTAMKKRMAP